MDESEKAALRSRIEAAFAARPYPGDHSIGRERPGCTGHEGNVVAAFFRGLDWRELRFADIQAGYDAPIDAIPAFMVPEGLAYYLPAFLLMALDLPPPGDPVWHGAPGDAHYLFGFVDSLCFALMRPPDDSLARQYALVKDMAQVPDEIKESLRHPTPEARAAERARVVEHQRLVGLLSDEERAVLREVLEVLAGHFRWDNPDDRFNNAAQALATGWG